MRVGYFQFYPRFGKAAENLEALCTAVAGTDAASWCSRSWPPAATCSPAGRRWRRSSPRPSRAPRPSACRRPAGAQAAGWWSDFPNGPAGPPRGAIPARCGCTTARPWSARRGWRECTARRTCATPRSCTPPPGTASRSSRSTASGSGSWAALITCSPTQPGPWRSRGPR